MTVRKTKTRKPRLTAEQKAFDADVRFEVLETLVDNAHGRIGEMASAIEELRVIALNAQTVQAARSAVDDAPPTMADMIATEDSLIGHWMAEQSSEGKTTVDLTIVEHIRTGIRLALSA